MLPNEVEYCGCLAVNSHQVGIEQGHGAPTEMHTAMAWSPKCLEHRHQHHAKAVNVQSGDDPPMTPSVTQSPDNHQEHLCIAELADEWDAI